MPWMNSCALRHAAASDRTPVQEQPAGSLNKLSTSIHARYGLASRQVAAPPTCASCLQCHESGRRSTQRLHAARPGTLVSTYMGWPHCCIRQKWDADMVQMWCPCNACALLVRHPTKPEESLVNTSATACHWCVKMPLAGSVTYQTKKFSMWMRMSCTPCCIAVSY